MNDRLLRACRCEPTDRTPVWLMRQAGRYLPEYRALRAKYDMLTMCRTPEIAVQVTLQPLERFDLDAAILFSDIMIPLAGMGVDFQIKESVGPVVANPVRDQKGANALRVIEPDESIPFVVEAVRLLRQELRDRVPLIGFAGAPFTLATYVVEGKPSRDLLVTKTFMHCDPNAWGTLMTKLAATVAKYLLAQIRAGAQAVQLFDSWVGALSPSDYERFVLPYSKQVFDALASARVPTIHFGTGIGGLLELMAQAGGDVIGVDWRIRMDQIAERMSLIAIQGNLDPAILLTTPQIIEEHTRQILDQVGKRNGHIFNLGHGVLPNTPVEHVKHLVDFVHKYTARED